MGSIDEESAQRLRELVQQYQLKKLTFGQYRAERGQLLDGLIAKPVRTDPGAARRR